MDGLLHLTTFPPLLPSTYETHKAKEPREWLRRGTQHRSGTGANHQGRV